ncbi:hypothetical protein L915_16898 [Phytophthora nicotianae]|uniref:Uncharacterized protein n=1 Tax=Phytophthora nicotianae TaxID=4792 RepID=W2G157_PHYNI|nr:hypothetical protein L915_16898 [Phytophthora nicotianae]
MMNLDEGKVLISLLPNDARTETTSANVRAWPRSPSGQLQLWRLRSTRV